MASEPPKVFINYNRADRDWAMDYRLIEAMRRRLRLASSRTPAGRLSHAIFAKPLLVILSLKIRSNYNAVILIAFFAASGLDVSGCNIPPKDEKAALHFCASSARRLLLC
jgi:hypothetical protein